MSSGAGLQGGSRCLSRSRARYSGMRITTVHLFQGADGEEAYAIRLPEDPDKYFRAERGFTHDFEHVWTVEFETDEGPDRWGTNWDQVLNRAMEAYAMRDPVISSYHWPAVGVEV
jgi:hypothetical protein